MSDYSKKTDDELNEAIAGARNEYGVRFGCKFIVLRECTTTQTVVPDYTHDWRLAGELLEDMRASLCFDSDTGLWECEYFTQYGEDEIHRFVRANTPQRAICEAWLAWKELE